MGRPRRRRTPHPAAPPGAGTGPAPDGERRRRYDLFTDADPTRPALDTLLEHRWLPTATAYKTLERAVRLGVVERRGRALFPLRH